MTLTKTSIIIAVACCKCGRDVLFTQEWKDRLYESGAVWYCTSCGNSQGWPGKKITDQRVAEIANLKHNLKLEAEAKRRAEKSASAYKGQVTRIKNRVGNGVCPCCNRYFAQLHRHMQTKHPEFKEAPTD